jgi:hypothetical protein
MVKPSIDAFAEKLAAPSDTAQLAKRAGKRPEERLA